MVKHAYTGKRRKNRRLVLQALYQWHINRQPAGDIKHQFQQQHSEENIDWVLFDTYLNDIIVNVDHIDTLLEPVIDRALDALDPVELSLLRLSTYELLEQNDIAYEAVINESIELAKMFGASDSYKYINAVLDTLCNRLPVRKAEKAGRLAKQQ